MSALRSAHELRGEAGDAHRTWALAERKQTDAILYAFLASRMREEQALQWMIDGAKSYPELPGAASTRPPGQ